ncbi:Peptidoglycan/LPS O-acetylase OafA/YrhL, contains acyltransferase and SGNH-hydrolase domains [Rhizobium sp. NFR07]|uniref:acyltransferase family protein n=1 Tax=Rhizobium sp. NFR07 TaxID=1566262 RepID=UPI0008E4F916|nr:acyltransferase [Rhizobium sp. NFR07]SFB27160.1 Peptidoglycan/LPS O-acetylase OafA/YrhL, contains acyltransferase and SGNH-hydrolase domains [Rhizobium sp. NFR07]
MTTAKPQRLLNLDILRLVSAVMVLLFHYGFRMRLSGEGGGIGFPELAPVAMWFDAGLLIFFAISGYVIAMSAKGRPAFEFAAGRFARLWPTFVLCATITAIVLTLFPVPTLEQPTVKQWLAHLVIVSRALGQPFLDGAYWTIVYEIIFYFWVFVFSALGLFKRHWRLIVIAWLALSALNELVIGSGAIQKLFITEYSGFFGFGLCLFKLRTGREKRDFIVLSAAAIWASCAAFITEPDFVEMYAIMRPELGLMLMGPLCLAAVVIATFSPALPIPAALAIGLGGLTYPLYLLHQNIGYAIFANIASEENRWLVLCGIVIALSTVAWVIARFFEPPCRRGLIALCLQGRDLALRRIRGTA